MKTLYVVLLFTLCVTSAWAVDTPGNTEAVLWCPTYWIWNAAYSEVIGYATAYHQTIYQGTINTQQVGSAQYTQTRDNILKSQAGIFFISKEHGHAQDVSAHILGGYQNQSDRGTDLAYLQTFTGDASDFFGFRPDNHLFWGIAMSSDRLDDDFVNNSTLFGMDDCNSWNLVNGPFDGSEAGIGYDGAVSTQTSAAEAITIWDRLGPQNFTLQNAVAGLTITRRGNIILHRNPAAEFLGARVEGGNLEFRALPRETQRFVVRGGPTAQGPWTEVSTVLPVSGQSLYTASAGSHPWLALVEIENDGTELQHAVLRSSPPVVEIPRRRPPSFEELEAKLYANEAARAGRQSMLTYYDPHRGEGIVLLTLTVEALHTAADQWFTRYWTDWWGYEGYSLSVPSDRLVIDALIESWYANVSAAGKTLVVHLIGDANDWEWWSNPARWPGQWAPVRQDRLNDGYPANGEPDKDLIPTWYLEDTRPPGENIGYWTPYIGSDWPYMDVNGDLIPDVLVTRWPVDSVYELMAWADKMQCYNDISLVPDLANIDVEIWSGELPVANEGDREQVLRIADEIDSVLPCTPEFFWMWQFPSASERMLAGVERINRGVNLVEMTSVRSNAAYPGNQLQNAGVYPAFEPEMLNNWQQPVFLTFTCGTADFARTRHPDLPDPVCEQLAVSPGCGSSHFFGQTAGTDQERNREIARESNIDFFDQSQGWPGPSMAQRQFNTMRRLATEHQGTYAMELTLRSRVLLSDPCSPFLAADVVVGVRDDAPRAIFPQNHPNPFNPVTTLSFSLKQSGPVELAVFDARGHRVATLVSAELQAGPHSLNWNAQDNTGRKLASGIYFARLIADGQTRSLKMTLLK